MDMTNRVKETKKYIQDVIDYAKENGYSEGIQRLYDAKNTTCLGAMLFRVRLYWASCNEEMNHKARNLVYLVHWEKEDEEKEIFEYKMDLMRKLVEVENEIKELKGSYYGELQD